MDEIIPAETTALVKRETTALVPTTIPTHTAEPVYPWGIKLPQAMLKKNAYFNEVTGQWEKHADSWCVVNKETGKPFCNHVGHNYNLIPYEESLELVCDSLTKAGLPFDLNIKLHHNGGLMVATFTTQVAEAVALGDMVSLEFQLKRSFNTLCSFILGLRGKRLACLNGMTIGEVLDMFKHKHTKQLTTNKILGQVQNGVVKFRDEFDVWNRWKNHIVGVADYEHIIETVGMGKQHQEGVGAVVEVSSGIRLDHAFHGAGIRTLPLWHLYNIFTQYITHKVDSFAVQHNFMKGLSKAMVPYRNEN